MFTVGEESDGCLLFLDVLLHHQDDGSTETSMYTGKQPTQAGT